jgi:exosortase
MNLLHRFRPATGLGLAPALGVFLGLALLWSYWPILAEMQNRWWRDPRYSHGILVPAFSVYLLWTRRAQRRFEQSHSNWLGLLLIAAAGVLKLAGAYYYVSWFDAVSLLPALGGLCWLLGGWPALRWALPSVAFLIFMVPLPYRLEMALGSPLQRMATRVSTYALQVLGMPALSSGNTIIIDDFTIGIIDACNGLGTAYMFLACAFAAAFMVPRPTLDRAVLIASAIPIALIVNVARIVATGVLHELFGKAVSDVVYHDLAGWLMMFAALLTLYVECKLLPHLFIDTGGPQGPPAGHHALTPPEVQRDAVTVASPAIPLLLGASLILAAGLLQGRWTNRWSVPRELGLAVSRLARVPMTLGAWKGRAETVESRVISAAELEGAVFRRYENSQTGHRINLLVVCGRPGPVSAHSPDICYPGAGYEMSRSQILKVPLSPAAGDASPEFLRGDFFRSGAVPPDHLVIMWSWSTTGAWRAPEHARFAFAAEPFLYKIYVSYRQAGPAAESEEGFVVDFLRQLMPALQQALFASGP